MTTSEQQQQGIALIVITHRSIFQIIAKQKNLNYEEQAAVIWVSPVDLMDIGIKDGANLRLENFAANVIIVRAKSDPDCQQGFARMLVSPYANRLVRYEPSQKKLPNFKRIEVIAKPTTESVTRLSDLVGAQIVKNPANSATSDISTAATNQL